MMNSQIGKMTGKAYSKVTFLVIIISIMTGVSQADPEKIPSCDTDKSLRKKEPSISSVKIKSNGSETKPSEETRISEEQLDQLIAEIKVSRKSNPPAAKKLLTLKDPRVIQRLIAEVEKADASFKPYSHYFIEALGQSGDPRAVKPLVDWMYRDRPYFTSSNSVAKALCQIGNQPAQRALREALRSNNTRIAHGVAQGLGKLGTPQALVFLDELRKSKKSEYRITAVLGYRNVDSEDARDIVIIFLSDTDGCVRYYAARRLQDINDKRVLAALIDSLELENITIRCKSSEFLRDAITAELKEATDKDRSASAKALLESTGTSGITLLEALSKATKDPFAYVRTNAAKSLGELGDTRTVEVLIPLLTDHSRGPRCAAFVALQQLGWKPKSRGDKVRAFMASGKWSEAETIARKITPANEQDNELQGEISYGEPILLYLKNHMRKKHYPEDPIPWIEFFKSKDKLFAKMELGFWSYPQAGFTATIRLLDRNGNVLAKENACFSNSGRCVTIPDWETEVVDVSLGDWKHLEKATAFDIAVKKMPHNKAIQEKR
ncbi:MAG: HEAT repeat domain-containing protein [Sedimentisphaerales bacterium]|nr:HEAT repeat domain-containing protein [Sedimentisphaerales bacterium]